jgi:hypothetical protein
MTTSLQQKIEVRRSRIAILDREREQLLIELVEFERALSLRGTDAAHQKPVRPLPVFGAWLAILQSLAEHKRFNAKEVRLVAQKLFSDGVLKKELTRDGVRAQLSLYTKKAIIRRMGGGNYCLTEKTKNGLLGHVAATSDFLEKLPGPEMDTLAQGTAGDARYPRPGRAQNERG